MDVTTFVLVIVAGYILLSVGSIFNGKRNVRVSAKEKGVSVINIETRIEPMFSGNARGGGFDVSYIVDYRDKDGVIKSGVCKYSFFSGVKWDS